MNVCSGMHGEGGVYGIPQMGVYVDKVLLPCPMVQVCRVKQGW